MIAQSEVEEIIGHLGAALNQSTASDDQIIVGHIKAAYEVALAISKGWNRHYHVAGTKMPNPSEIIASTKIPGAGRIGRTAAKYILANLELAGFKIVKSNETEKEQKQ